ncbi:hypothetical protein [Marinobacter psychrophilus]|uniref:hypothetical protein n=1 Tax=Marinobacter psychrophilus TaxID=330734 RepID=UPI0018DCFC6A|nr:hypothetical protein [Marinobacter psychrophilus]
MKQPAECSLKHSPQHSAAADQRWKSSSDDGLWASPYTLKSGETQHHSLGHSQIWVTLLDMEWQIRSQQEEQQQVPKDWKLVTGHSLPSSDIPVQRFIRNGDAEMVTYVPAMADRPTVIRPYQPLTIAAEGQCIIYVGTALWMNVCIGPKQLLVASIPLSEPSLTWVGSNTMEGELCYSAQSYARLALEAVPKRPWRAVTPVNIHNRRPQPLLVERFNLPTQLLSIHRNHLGQLWTPGVNVEVDTDVNAASMRVDPSPPPAAGPCEPLGPAREQVSRGRFVRTLDRIFG